MVLHGIVSGSLSRKGSRCTHLNGFHYVVANVKNVHHADPGQNRESFATRSTPVIRPSSAEYSLSGRTPASESAFTARASIHPDSTYTPARNRYLQRIGESRWQLGFLGLVAYFIVEYSQLQLMYPVLQPLALGKVAVVLAAMGWVLAPKAPHVAGVKQGLVDKTFLVLVFAALFSTLLAQYPEGAWNGFLDLLRWAVVYFIISRLTDNSWRLRAICFVWLLLNFKMGQFVCRTYATWHGTGVDEMSLVSHGIGGTGWFANAADMGVAMCLIWPVAVCLLFSRPRGLYKLLLIGASTACLGAILLCGSRGAVVGAVVVVIAVLVKNPKKIAALLMIALLAIGLWFVFPEASKERFRSARTPDQDQTAHHRLVLWKAGIKMWADNPIFGVGLNNFPLVRWSRYPIDINNQVPSVAHNLYIQGISELGILGMLPMVMLWLSLFRANASSRKMLMSMGSEQRRSFEYCLAAGLDLGCIGYLASGTFVSVLWYPHIFVLLGLSVALENVVRRKQLAASATDSPPRQRLLPAW
jgi:O-antigen ligase